MQLFISLFDLLTVTPKLHSSSVMTNNTFNIKIKQKLAGQRKSSTHSSFINMSVKTSGAEQSGEALRLSALGDLTGCLARLLLPLVISWSFSQIPCPLRPVSYQEGVIRVFQGGILQPHH